METLAGYKIIKQSGDNGCQIRITVIEVNGCEFEVNEYSDSVQIYHNGLRRHGSYAWFGISKRIFLHAPWTWFRSNEYMFKREINKMLDRKDKITDLLKS